MKRTCECAYCHHHRKYHVGNKGRCAICLKCEVFL